jgi:hypothetical protein
VSQQGASVRGPTFDIARAIARKAPSGEVWASRILVDLVPGSDLKFEETRASVATEDREIPLLLLRGQS